MPLQMKGFDKLLGDVRRFEEDLRTPASFYARHRAEYHEKARDLAVQTLNLLRPPDVKPEDWKRKVDRIASRVVTEALSGGHGVIFSIADPGEPTDGSLAPNSARPSSQVMSYEDIKEWIRAGIKGEPGGKRITAIDEKTMREKGVDGVATIVMKAYYSAKPDARYTRLRAAIQRYFLGARAAESTPLLDAVATAWREHFSTVIPRDLEDYAATLCREF